MSSNLQKTILQALIHNEDYCRTALPFIKPEYFEGAYRLTYKLIYDFVDKYNKRPDSRILQIELEKKADSVTDESLPVISALIADIAEEKPFQLPWLINSTETWCRERAVLLAVIRSMDIIEGKEKDVSDTAIPGILSDALAVTFDTSVGHDYIGDYEHRYDLYHAPDEDRISFDIELLNKITKGGLLPKTLNVLMAGTGVGKSLAMCHMAASFLNQGKNVLYITMEMAEERIAERIDANLMNVPIDQLPNLSHDMYADRIKRIQKKTTGTMIIKEYPTASAHVGHFRALLKELEMKKGFKPDVIFIDYLNICASARMRGVGGSVNTYSFVKAIAEEVRGLAVEFALPIVTATQTNREGFSNSDVSLTETSESFGLPATADLFLALIRTEELDELGQVMVKQLKNRYNDLAMDRRFVVGIDKSKMRLFDCDASQDDLMKEPTNTKVQTFKPNADKPKFADFKV